MTQNTNGARRSERLQEEKLLHGLSNTKKRKTPAQGRRGEEKTRAHREKQLQKQARNTKIKKSYSRR